MNQPKKGCFNGMALGKQPVTSSSTPNEKSMKIPVALVDDQRLFVESLSVLINAFDSFEVVFYAVNGPELIQKLQVATTLPEILLVDVRMEGMDGSEITALVHQKYPLIRIAALSTDDEDYSIIKMIKAGCSAYLVKDLISGVEFKKALHEIHEKGYYNGDAVNVNSRRLKQYKEVALTEKETKFVKLSASDLTYKEIAGKMNLAQRTIDGYREEVFKKLHVQSRVGMVMEALKRGLIAI